MYSVGSLQGLGALLAQVQDSSEQVMTYASHSLHPTEKNLHNYNSFKLELLALVWANTKKFAEYLTRADIEVFMDNHCLTYLDTTKLRPLEQR